jgi:hypothetical protein
MLLLLPLFPLLHCAQSAEGVVVMLSICPLATAAAAAAAAVWFARI